ncbi:NUDIX hydrolase [Sagittula sp. NFXS13]|uniref:8-oxo-dGTP diphosphatase n=1 Tax=Sagittula marina TaxID=943940 RepID=A0A7W6GQC6_9RHOB|nr:NUDIX hydrolase [Sagittula marina]MBB3983765.1 8-oxo-dGTP diphosphatase [Sagittula marina]
MRRYGEAPIDGQNYIFRPGVYAVLPQGNDLLLTHQSEPFPEYQLPGGGIDPGESPLQALHREVWEETGWKIANPRRLGAFRRFTWMPEYEIWAEKLCMLYVARPVLRLVEPIEPGHSAVWMDANQAVRELGNPGERDIVARYLR